MAAATGLCDYSKTTSYMMICSVHAYWITHCNCNDSVVLIPWGKVSTLIPFIDVYAVKIEISAIVGTHVPFLAMLGPRDVVNTCSAR